jgi:sarcosine oxidase
MSYDAIVLGTGAVGSAALWALAKRGQRVLGIDRFPAGHDRGSSHGETRVIRQAYFEHEDYVPLLLRSYELWTELERAAGRALFIPTGLVQIGAPEGEVVSGVLKASAKHQISVETLTPSELRRRYPMLRCPEASVAVYEPTGGILRPEACVRSMVAEAERLGAQTRLETVIRWRAEGEGVRVETDAGVHRAARLVIAAGAWSTALLGCSLPSLSLQVLRKPLYWFGGASSNWSASEGAPVFLYETDAGVFYGFPSLEPGIIKVAEHTGGASVDDPLLIDRSQWPNETERVASFVRRSLVGVSGGVQRHAVCMYTVSPDQHFIVDRHPKHESVVFAAGLSGHGFKMVTVLGEALAELAMDGRSAHPIGFLSASRLSSDRAP